MNDHGNPTPQLKRSSASLTGGLVVALAAAILAALVVAESGVDNEVTRLMVGVAAGILFGGYVRLADL